MMKSEHDCLPWAISYRPDKMGDVYGNGPAVLAVRKWADSWMRGKPSKKALLLYGPAGVGKTSTAYALANEYGWDVVETNASDNRTEDVINVMVGIGSQVHTLTGRKKLILIEEVDGLHGVKDRGGAPAMAEAIKGTKVPIILTLNDINSKKVGQIKRLVEKVQFKRVSDADVVALLSKIANERKVKAEEGLLKRIAAGADGDVRAAINDLQSICENEASAPDFEPDQRNREIDIFNALQKIFKGIGYAEMRKVLWDLDEEQQNVLLWLAENVPAEYKGRDEIASAYQNLSRADMFMGRIINRQYWGFMRYANDLMSSGVALSKNKPYYGFTRYQFPWWIIKMGQTRGKRSTENKIAAKISPIVHSSKREIVKNYIPLLSVLVKRGKVPGVYGLDEEEIEYLRESATKT